ncbi:MAG: radical SAM family heme chaperone HemW [Clostridiaceae bacterium]|nr:radical SAM family heme chaperone HemW [Clostridiaceae bacterium]
MQHIFASKQEVKSVYIHVPFCLSKCHYCDFYSEASSESRICQWHETILTEMRLNHSAALTGVFNKGSLETIYYGGGTPSIVPPSFYAEQLKYLDDLFGIAKDAEITIEANPGVISPLSLYRTAGFNRISFGFQSASDKLIQIMGRRTKAKAFIKDISEAQKADFDRICADIMIGLPGQSLQDINETLDLIFSLPIGHVSYYSLTLSEGTPFWNRYAHNQELLPEEDLERKMYDLTLQRLSEEGIIPYEISNAACIGEESRHNQVYWLADSYMGLGPSARSYLGGIRYGNPASLQQWSRLVNKPDFSNIRTCLPGHIEEIVDESAARAETMILGLRLLQGVEYDNFFQRHNIDLRLLYPRQIARLSERELIEQDDSGIRLTRLGLDLANQVFLEFI